MPDNVRASILVIGTGPMAEAYTKVLKALDIRFTVIGRGSESAKVFEMNTGVKPETGGLEKYLRNHPVQGDTKAIIAVGTENLMPMLLLLSDYNLASVLVEKPAALSIEELLKEGRKLSDFAGDIFVAYNRRFYKSVEESQKLIALDGGLTGIHFEFTEWSHKITPLKKYPGVKENWFFANSTHVVDLAFYFAGKPIDWKAYKKTGDIDWHKQTAFAGAGVTEQNVLFTYMANWESAGRWGIELLTKERRIYLRPLEMVSVQLKGSVEVSPREFDSSVDNAYKPGLYEMVKAFVMTPDQNDPRLLRFTDHLTAAKEVYQPMISGE